MTRKTAILLSLVIFLGVSVAGQNRLPGKWLLTSITDENGTEVSVPEKGRITMNFKRNSLLTAYGCNIISGKYSLRKRAIKITFTRSTAKACPKMEIEATEATFKRLVDFVTNYSIRNYELILSGAKNKPNLRFRRMQE